MGLLLHHIIFIDRAGYISAVKQHKMTYLSNTDWTTQRQVLRMTLSIFINIVNYQLCYCLCKITRKWFKNAEVKQQTTNFLNQKTITQNSFPQQRNNLIKLIQYSIHIMTNHTGKEGIPQLALVFLLILIFSTNSALIDSTQKQFDYSSIVSGENNISGLVSVKKTEQKTNSQKGSDANSQQLVGNRVNNEAVVNEFYNFVKLSQKENQNLNSNITTNTSIESKSTQAQSFSGYGGLTLSDLAAVQFYSYGSTNNEKNQSVTNQLLTLDTAKNVNSSIDNPTKQQPMPTFDLTKVSQKQLRNSSAPNSINGQNNTIMTAQEVNKLQASLINLQKQMEVNQNQLISKRFNVQNTQKTYSNSNKTQNQTIQTQQDILSNTKINKTNTGYDNNLNFIASTTPPPPIPPTPISSTPIPTQSTYDNMMANLQSSISSRFNRLFNP